MRRRFDGTALRRAREASGLTRELLAHQIGRTASAVCAYETGHRVPSAGTLVALIDELDVSVDALFVAIEASPSVQATRS